MIIINAAAAIAFPFGVGCVASLWFTQFNTGTGFATPNKTGFILFCGTMLSLTAFPVLCAILQQGKIVNTPLGIVVCCYKFHGRM